MSDDALVSVLESVIDDLCVAVAAIRGGEHGVAAASLHVALERIRAAQKRRAK